MPRDNHPRERQARKLARKQGTRPPYQRVLIVAEGEKTEPLYFDDIRQQSRVPSAHIQVLPSAYGTEPQQVVDFAKDTLKKSRAFEWVFAVFDRDEHLTYHEALQAAKRLDRTLLNDERKKVNFVAVPSVPCFELWLLIHFVDARAFWHRAEVFRRVQQYIQNYEKGSASVYAATEARLPVATQRAQWLKGHFDPATGTDPYTKVDEVVNLLRSIRPARR